MPDSVSKGFDPGMKTGSLKKGLSHGRANPLQTEFGIHHRLESCMVHNTYTNLLECIVYEFLRSGDSKCEKYAD